MKYQWKETSPGRVERHLDNSERFLKAVAIPFRSLDRENWALNVILNVSFPDNGSPQDSLVDSLREAWIKLRYHHPFIAVDLHLDENKFAYATPDKEALQNWLSASFFVHQNSNVDEFLLSAKWSDASSIHYFPQSSELLMRTHHWLVDGVGGLHLANRFLEIFAAGGPTPKFGDEMDRLPPPFFDAADLPEGTEPVALGKAQSKFMEFAGNLPSIGLPIEKSPTGPGGTIRKSIKFSQEQLGAILQACRAKNLTIGAAVHAAVAVATQEKAYKFDLAKNFTTVVFFDYRKYLPAPYNQTRQYPTGVWMLAQPFSLPPADFATQAEACSKVYKQPVAPETFPMWDGYETFVGMMADAFSAPPPPGLPLPSQPQLSSIGVVDGKIQHSYQGENPVTVSRVEPVLDIMVTTPLIFQWTFNGTFYINACFNANWHPDGSIEEFLNRVGEVLKEGTGVA